MGVQYFPSRVQWGRVLQWGGGWCHCGRANGRFDGYPCALHYRTLRCNCPHLWVEESKTIARYIVREAVGPVGI